jgi:hypothetical protein
VLDEYLRRQDGVLTLAQAVHSGLSRQAVHRRVKSGHCRRCAPAVYFADDRPFTDSARIRSTVWGHGDHASASGLTAAWWHGLTRFAPDIVERKGLQVTVLPLTVVEAAVRHRAGTALMDSALQRHVDLRELWRAHLRNKGRYRSPTARRLLQAASDGARSEAERLLVKLLRDNDTTMKDEPSRGRIQGRRGVSQAEGRYRDRRLGVSQPPGRLPERP